MFFGVLAGDAAILLALASRVVGLVSLFYGYDPESPAEKLFVMSVVNAGTAVSASAKTAAMGDISRLTQALLRGKAWDVLSESVVTRVSISQLRTAISERYHHGLRHVQDQLTTWPHRPVCQRLHLGSGRRRPGSRLGYRVPLRGAITDVTPPTGGKSAYEFKAQQESSPARP